jgi:sulfofructose kinase
MLTPLALLQQNTTIDGTTPERARTFDVVGLGVSTLDLFMIVDEFPGSELVQRAHSSLLQGGGPVATALVALSKLGCRTAMIDKLGDDWRGKRILEEFEVEGVSVNQLTLVKDHTSSIATVLVRKGDGARTIVFSPGDVDELFPSELPEIALLSSRILHLNGRHLPACLAGAQLAKQHDVLVSFDGGAHRFNDRLRELIHLMDVCIVAREFAYAFSGEEHIDNSATKLLQSGPKIVVITGGTEGSWAFDQSGQRVHQPAFLSGSRVDTTGAGDAYHGAFLCGIINNYSLKQCARFAGAVAAINTGKLGGRSALPSMNDTLKFLAAHQGESE